MIYSQEYKGVLIEISNEYRNYDKIVVKFNVGGSDYGNACTLSEQFSFEDRKKQLLSYAHGVIDKHIT